MALPRQLADSGVHASPASALLAEKERLVGSIRRFPGVGIHAATIEAVRDFLIRFNDEGGIPWVRIYHSFPAWQQECGLLTEQWDKDAMFEGAKVIFTLLDPHGGRFSREALVRDGTWIIKAAQTIANHVVVSKLYYKTGGSGFTLFEFRLTMEPQPRVAICVLYRTNYRRVILDLKQYVLQGFFPGQNQGNTRMQPIHPDYHLDGSLNNPRVDYTYNLASNNGTYIPGANQADQMVVQLEEHYLAHNVGGLTNGSQPDYTTNLGLNSESSGYHPPAETETQMSWPMDDMYDDMLWETDMLTGQHSQADGMPTKSYYDKTLFGNSSIHASTPIQDAMANVNEPLLEPFHLCEDYSMATAHYHTQDAMLHFDQTDGYGELKDPFHPGKII